MARRPAPLLHRPHSQKARNIEANANCVATTGTNAYRSGIDVTVDCTAEPITDDATLNRLTQLWKDKLDWVFQVGQGVLLDPVVAHPALVFAITPRKVLAFSKNPYSQTRYVR